jgi:hypothetical protein
LTVQLESRTMNLLKKITQLFLVIIVIALQFENIYSLKAESDVVKVLKTKRSEKNDKCPSKTKTTTVLNVLTVSIDLIYN